MVLFGGEEGTETPTPWTGDAENAQAMTTRTQVNHGRIIAAIIQLRFPFSAPRFLLED